MRILMPCWFAMNRVLIICAVLFSLGLLGMAALVGRGEAREIQILLCPYPRIEVVKPEKWTAEDEARIEFFHRRCSEIYRPGYCAVRITKRHFQNYWVLCRGPG